MKKIMLLIAALALAGQTMPKSMTQEQGEQYMQQQIANLQQQQQTLMKSFKYQFKFTNNTYYTLTVKLKFADGKTQSASVAAEDYPNGKTHPMLFLSNSCLTDAWVSGTMPVSGVSAIGVSGGSSESISTDHHGMNICTSKEFTIDALSNDPFIQLNWK